MKESTNTDYEWTRREESKREDAVGPAGVTCGAAVLPPTPGNAACTGRRGPRDARRQSELSRERWWATDRFPGTGASGFPRRPRPPSPSCHYQSCVNSRRRTPGPLSLRAAPRPRPCRGVQNCGDLIHSLHDCVAESDLPKARPAGTVPRSGFGDLVHPPPAASGVPTNAVSPASSDRAPERLGPSPQMCRFPSVLGSLNSPDALSVLDGLSRKRLRDPAAAPCPRHTQNDGVPRARVPPVASPSSPDLGSCTSPRERRLLAHEPHG